ncbi:universal stress protein [Actinomycetospora chlora]|uniref:Universal stress protein n=1 Tax=Actinomycetospora chlora TaxID=663608 RepID=A0ABP9AMV7_9PSEU
MSEGTDPRPLVVVGVDGSRDADAALHHAVAEARRRHGRVLAVAACDVPPWSAVDVESLPTDPEAVRHGAEVRARRHVEELLATAGDVPVTVVGRLGRPTRVLVDEARDAALLVVGHRGRGAFRSAALGSVGLGCLLHARCPVTVVRPPARADAGGTTPARAEVAR